MGYRLDFLVGETRANLCLNCPRITRKVFFLKDIHKPLFLRYTAFASEAPV